MPWRWRATVRPPRASPWLRPCVGRPRCRGNGRQFDGTVVGTDPTHDLAVVKIAATGLPTVTLGNSDKLQIGQLAIAIGDPLGTFAGTVTTGIVSGTGRSIDVQDPQTRAAVHLTA